MSRFGRDPRHSSGDLAYGDYYEHEHNTAGGRWDAERFTRERERAERPRAPKLVEHDRFEERDVYESPHATRGGHGWRRRESSADGFYGGPGSRGAPHEFEERDRFTFEERYGPPARRHGPSRYHEDDVDSFRESPSRGQMVPFESRRTSVNRDYGPPPQRTSARPNFIRRQSSLDTFDRKPMPRYGDRMREPPETIVVPSAERRRSPPRYIERDLENSMVPERGRHAHDDFTGYREREVSTVRRRRAGSEVEYRERDSFEVVEEGPDNPYPRKGKTKMPARLVNKRAIIELGYPFEEEVRRKAFPHLLYKV